MEGNSVIETRYEHLIIDSGAIIHKMNLETISKVF